VLVIPVAGTMLRIVNPGAVVTEHGRYRFVPLR
jgi:protein-L-isoaspartate(D-aspartate) O-methyltransferase